MFESDVFHARIARKPFPSTAKIMLDSCRIHAETQTRALSTPTESRADAASLPRIRDSAAPRHQPSSSRSEQRRYGAGQQPHITKRHRWLASRVSVAPNRNATVGRCRQLLNHNAAPLVCTTCQQSASLGGIASQPNRATHQQAASLAIGQRRCDSVSRSFLCARALPQRSRLLFRAVSEFS